jgi:HSP20 family protein
MSLIKVKKDGDLFPSLMSDFFDTDKFFNRKWMDRTFDSALPAVNIKETPKSYDLEVAAPGFRKEDFTVSADDNLLTVSAQKSSEVNDENDRFTRREFSYSSFNRSFRLPQDVNGDAIEAKYTDGILHVSITKKEPAKAAPKKEIKVK